MTNIGKKLENLKIFIKDLESVVIAYSGGVDSSLLAKVCYDILGRNAVAVTATSETYPPHELGDSKRMAEKIGIRHMVIKTDELSNETFVKNPPERCYLCKTELFTKLRDISKELGFKNIVDGSNVDDDSDFRPGQRAAMELRIRSPLKETGLTKNDVRDISRLLGLETWDKPSLACMSSRIPYGQEITSGKLSMVSKAEDFLRDMGFSRLRVRHHNTIARIEIPIDDMPSIINNDLRMAIITRFKEIGFNYITLDIEGLRSGSMNEVIELSSNTTRPSSRSPQSTTRNPHPAPRTPQRLTIYTDGASRGNPGKAGIGIAIYEGMLDTQTEPILLEEISEYIGETTNNIAEYNAFKRAVERAIELNPGEVIFKSDSELLVKQINKEYRVRDQKLIPLYKDVSQLLKGLSNWKVVHIMRGENNCADNLANKGIDSAIDSLKQ